MSTKDKLRYFYGEQQRLKNQIKETDAIIASLINDYCTEQNLLCKPHPDRIKNLILSKRD